MQVERREGYELQLVMVMATGCQWDGHVSVEKSITGYVVRKFALETKKSMHNLCPTDKPNKLIMGKYPKNLNPKP